MTSNQSALDLIGGEAMLTRLKAKQIQHTEAGGIAFLVPILGGLVSVAINRDEEHWSINLGLDVVSTMPRSLVEVPGRNLGLILSHLFLL